MPGDTLTLHLRVSLSGAGAPIVLSAGPPLRRVLAYPVGQVAPHYLLVTDGLTQLDTGHEEPLGWGVELCLRASAASPAAVRFLESVARLVIQSRGRLDLPESVDVDAPPGAVLLQESNAVPTLTVQGDKVRFVDVTAIEEEDLEEDVDELVARRADDGDIWDPDAPPRPEKAPEPPLVWEGEAPSVREAWRRIDQALERLAPGLSSKLEGPASLEAIAANHSPEYTIDSNPRVPCGSPSRDVPRQVFPNLKTQGASNTGGRAMPSNGCVPPSPMREDDTLSLTSGGREP